jgi:hypothetical protein
MKKFTNNISQISRLILGLAVGLLLAIPAGAETLTVYTAVEAEDLKRYASAFNEDHPDIKIRWVRDSTGIVTAKLACGKEQPQSGCDLGTGSNKFDAASVRRYASVIFSERIGEA